MNTLEIKKETVAVLKKELEINASVRASLESLLNSYISYVEGNVPSEFYKAFGVGVAGSSHQHGEHYGFYCSDADGREFYATPGRGYHIGGDFNAYVSGSSFIQMKEFARLLPGLAESGIAALKQANEEASHILKGLDFEALK